MSSWTERLEQARVEQVRRNADPLLGLLQKTVRGMESVSTNALLTLIGVPVNTGNARRIAPLMVTLGFVPLKSRRLMPGGFRETVTRGWARPVRNNRPDGRTTALQVGDNSGVVQ